MKILVAGSTGYLGTYIVKALMNRPFKFKALARHTKQLELLGLHPNEIIKAEVTQRKTLADTCRGIDVVISTLGITRQKDGLTYMDVDYQANKNLLDEAIQNGVKKFIYVSVLHGDELTHLKLCEAKERFVKELQHSGLEYCIIRPSGFFSDIREIYNMALNGRVFLFGNGEFQLNPIHGADLAKICIDAIYTSKQNIEVGGKDVLSQKEIAELAFEIMDKKPSITFIPDWVRKLILGVAPFFTPKSKYGPLEFFLNVIAMDMYTHTYGKHGLRTYFKQLKQHR